MNYFVDTSAFLAILNATDLNHEQGATAWSKLVTEGNSLISTNYVLVETIALLQARLGMEAVMTFTEDIIPVLSVSWAGEKTFSTALTMLTSISRRKISLVDCVSFITMRKGGIRSAFTFDKHFTEQGFEVIPVI